MRFIFDDVMCVSQLICWCIFCSKILSSLSRDCDKYLLDLERTCTTHKEMTANFSKLSMSETEFHELSTTSHFVHDNVETNQPRPYKVLRDRTNLNRQMQSNRVTTSTFRIDIFLQTCFCFLPDYTSQSLFLSLKAISKTTLMRLSVT